jgi:AcrR family transcriptional regulator
MLIAAAWAARERGAAAVCVTDVVTRAGVSRRTFYEIFRDREECLQAALEEAIVRAAARVLPAWRGDEGWREAIKAALLAFLCFLDEEPRLGMFLVVDSLGGGDWMLARRAAVMESLIEAVDRGRAVGRSSAGLSRVTAEGVVGAVLSIVHARLHARSLGDRSPMRGLLGQLMGILVLPYLGPAAAIRERDRSPSKTLSEPVAPAGDELRDLDIRLTYRTVRVLRAVRELDEGEGRPSNREVGAHAGIVDPGQVSKLLSRLARADLVENLGGGEHGEPNAWRLTAKGAQIERAARSGD